MRRHEYRSDFSSLTRMDQGEALDAPQPFVDWVPRRGLTQRETV